MTSASPIEVPKIEDNTDYNSIMSQTSAELQNNVTSTQSQVDSILNNQNRVVTDLNSQSALLANKDKELIDTEISLGGDTERDNIAKVTEQIANLNAQSSQLNREAQAIPLQLQQELSGKGATKAGAQPIETSRLRDNAIKALSIAQQSDTAIAQLTGSSVKLKQAQDKAKQIIDLKYKPIEIKLQSLQAQYNANKEMLDRVDKKLSEQYKLKLDNQKEVLKIKREDEKQMSDLIIKARGQGASDGIIARAMNAKTPMSVAVALGQYAGDYLQTQKLKAEIAKINAETSKQYNEIAKTKVEQGALTQKQVNKYRDAYSKADNLSNTIKDTMSILDNNSVVAGSSVGRALTGWLPGTDARTVNNKLDTVKASLGFEELQNMRDNSPTGGALGQVTEKELNFLQSAQYNLDNWQDTDELKSNLSKIKNSFDYLKYVNEQYLQGATSVIPKEAFILEQNKRALEETGRIFNNRGNANPYDEVETLLIN